MMNDLIPELGRRRRAAWGAYKSIEDVVKKTRNTRLRAHLFNTTVLPALTYASETWAFRKQEENAPNVGVNWLAASSSTPGVVRQPPLPSAPQKQQCEQIFIVPYLPSDVLSETP
ncbi:hypothetical protein RB195_020032 [Necator americanus]|uniref:Uncharacterized protein n=1 Tax=Necator americanus TaxID=51031 RepID=A0ABR1CKF7_NECAM